MAELENSENSHCKTIRKPERWEERERERNNFLGNGQMTEKDGDPWKKGNRQGKA